MNGPPAPIRKRRRERRPGTGTVSFARGIPSPDMFPLEQLAESARRAVESDGRVALNYGPPGGFGPLREWLGARHGVAPERGCSSRRVR